MLLCTHRNQKADIPSAAPIWNLPEPIAGGLPRVLAIAILLIASATSSLNSQQSPNPGKPILLPEANRPPDANAQMAMREQQNKKQSFEAANIERKKQINDDSARLLKLASDLKAEVDKTSKDTLSIGVIRKADEIEKLAHSVKEKMKLTMSAN